MNESLNGVKNISAVAPRCRCLLKSEQVPHQNFSFFSTWTCSIIASVCVQGKSLDLHPSSGILKGTVQYFLKGPLIGFLCPACLPDVPRLFFSNSIRSIPATPYSPHLSFPASVPSPGPDYPRHSDHPFIYTARLLCSSVSSHMFASLFFLASCFCFSSICYLYVYPDLYLPACLYPVLNKSLKSSCRPPPSTAPLPVLDVISVLIFSSNSRQEKQIFDAYFPKCIYISL